MGAGITAIVVTFNRKRLLHNCLHALTMQTCKPDQILVVDNASTDGTLEMLTRQGWLEHEGVELLVLEQNFGGAGGFAKGLELAIDRGAEWVWMMDDDAEPHPDALAELLIVADDPGNIYGSLAVNGNETAWITTLFGDEHRTVDRPEMIPARARVQSLPFLGFLIHRKLVMRIGLPDAGYFIAADDVEYCLRAERAGAHIIIAGNSRIEHPKSERYVVRLPGRSLTCLRLPPWKRYYDTRNRLLIARKYYGPRLFTQTIPGSFVRFFAALRYEPNRLSQTWAFMTGMIDGLLGFKGNRHARWHIPQ
jgi:GT2 family glycosyltransferase